VSQLKKRKDYLVDDGREPDVYSAFAVPLVTSAVYVRAKSKENIIQACQNIYSAWATLRNIVLVPEEECEALMKEPKMFIPEDWVKFRKGKYKGDVALVTELDADNRTCKAFYIPRLNLDGKRKTNPRGGRPQQALFDPVVARSAGEGGRISVVDNQRKIYRYRNQTYTSGLITEDALSLNKVIQAPVTPTYEEFITFQKTGILDFGQYDRTLRNLEAHSLKVGTKVTVIVGQQMGLQGTVKELVDQDAIRIEFSSDTQATSLDVVVPNKYVKISDYEMGDSVVVIRGDKMGLKGLVVEVTKGCVIIYDGNSKETVGLSVKLEAKLTKKIILVYQVVSGGRTLSTS
jgi:transcription elongation factor